MDLTRWGVDGAAAVIESRVRESGGTPKELTASEVAARAVQEIRETDERTAFLNSGFGVQAARSEFDKLFDQVKRVCATSSGLVGNPVRERDIVSMDALGVSRKVAFVFQLLVGDSLRGSVLRLVQSDWSSSSVRQWDKEYHFDFGPSGEHGWREGVEEGRGEFFSTERLVDRMAKKLIDAVRDKRTNRKSSRFITW